MRYKRITGIILNVPFTLLVFTKKDEKIQHKSFCFLSEDLNHDISAVFEIQRIYTSYLKSSFSILNKVHYFSDGCVAQYKNKYNFYNLCQHEQDLYV